MEDYIKKIIIKKIIKDDGIGTITTADFDSDDVTDEDYKSAVEEGLLYDYIKEKYNNKSVNKHLSEYCAGDIILLMAYILFPPSSKDMTEIVKISTNVYSKLIKVYTAKFQKLLNKSLKDIYKDYYPNDLNGIIRDLLNTDGIMGETKLHNKDEDEEKQKKVLNDTKEAALFIQLQILFDMKIKEDDLEVKYILLQDLILESSSTKANEHVGGSDSGSKENITEEVFNSFLILHEHIKKTLIPDTIHIVYSILTLMETFYINTKKEYSKFQINNIKQKYNNICLPKKKTNKQILRKDFLIDSLNFIVGQDHFIEEFEINIDEINNIILLIDNSKKISSKQFEDILESIKDQITKKMPLVKLKETVKDDIKKYHEELKRNEARAREEEQAAAAAKQRLRENAEKKRREKMEAEEARRKKAEEEAKVARKKAEESRRQKAEEEEKAKRQAEATRKEEEAEAARQEEARKKADEARVAREEAERQKKAEEEEAQRLKAEEEAEARKKEAEARQEEARKKEEVERQKAAEEEEEEARIKEEEARKKEEAERQKAEEEKEARIKEEAQIEEARTKLNDVTKQTENAKTSLENVKGKLNNIEILTQNIKDTIAGLDDKNIENDIAIIQSSISKANAFLAEADDAVKEAQEASRNAYSTAEEIENTEYKISAYTEVSKANEYSSDAQNTAKTANDLISDTINIVYRELINKIKILESLNKTDINRESTIKTELNSYQEKLNNIKTNIESKLETVNTISTSTDPTNIEQLLHTLTEIKNSLNIYNDDLKKIDLQETRELCDKANINIDKRLDLLNKYYNCALSLEINVEDFNKIYNKVKEQLEKSKDAIQNAKSEINSIDHSLSEITQQIKTNLSIIEVLKTKLNQTVKDIDAASYVKTQTELVNKSLETVNSESDKVTKLMEDIDLKTQQKKEILTGLKIIGENFTKAKEATQNANTAAESALSSADNAKICAEKIKDQKYKDKADKHVIKGIQESYEAQINAKKAIDNLNVTYTKVYDYLIEKIKSIKIFHDTRLTPIFNSFKSIMKDNKQTQIQTSFDNIKTNIPPTIEETEQYITNLNEYDSELIILTEKFKAAKDSYNNEQTGVVVLPKLLSHLKSYNTKATEIEKECPGISTLKEYEQTYKPIFDLLNSATEYSAKIQEYIKQIDPALTETSEQIKNTIKKITVHKETLLKEKEKNSIGKQLGNIFDISYKPNTTVQPSRLNSDDLQNIKEYIQLILISYPPIKNIYDILKNIYDKLSDFINKNTNRVPITEITHIIIVLFICLYNYEIDKMAFILSNPNISSNYEIYLTRKFLRIKLFDISLITILRIYINTINQVTYTDEDIKTNLKDKLKLTTTQHTKDEEITEEPLNLYYIIYNNSQYRVYDQDDYQVSEYNTLYENNTWIQKLKIYYAFTSFKLYKKYVSSSDTTFIDELDNQINKNKSLKIELIQNTNYEDLLLDTET